MLRSREPLLKATDWMDKIKSLLTPRASVAPQIYGLPMIPKKDCPLRPIVKHNWVLLCLTAKIREHEQKKRRNQFSG